MAAEIVENARIFSLSLSLSLSISLYFLLGRRSTPMGEKVARKILRPDFAEIFQHDRSRRMTQKAGNSCKGIMNASKNARDSAPLVYHYVHH